MNNLCFLANLAVTQPLTIAALRLTLRKLSRTDRDPLRSGIIKICQNNFRGLYRISRAPCQERLFQIFRPYHSAEDYDFPLNGVPGFSGRVFDVSIFIASKVLKIFLIPLWQFVLLVAAGQLASWIKWRRLSRFRDGIYAVSSLCLFPLAGLCDRWKIMPPPPAKR